MSDWPSSYGDTTAEYVAAHRAGLISGRQALFWVEGPDSVSFLQGILTQDVEAMEPGTVARSMLLEPRGKLAALMWLLRGDDRVGLLTSVERIDQTMEDLGRWRFRVDAELRRDERPVAEVWGNGAVDVVGRVAGVTGGWADNSGVLVVRVPLGPLDRVVVAGVDEAELIGAGAVPVGSVAAESVRIESGEPRMGIDVNESTIPQESGLVPDAVSFTKGCYLGQELVARIDTRGHVNRQLRGVRMLENVLPPTGAVVRNDERELGTITSVGESLDLRAPIAMALIRREAEPGTEVSVQWDGGSAAAVVEAFPLVGGTAD